MAREPTDLVPTEPAALTVADASGRTPDAYEQKFMSDQGTVLYRDKHRAPWPLHALLGAAALVVLGSAVATGAWVGAAIGLPVLAMVWVLLSVLRVTVSTGGVSVQYGLFGPQIPSGAIESAEATTYDWKQFGGWGIRRSRQGEWIYNMPGDGGRAVRIVWRDRQGRRRVTLIGSPQPEPLAQQIRRARAALPASGERKALPEE